MSNGSLISKENAKAMIQAYQDNAPTDAIYAHLYDADLIQQLLNEEDTEGIRIYHGLDSEGKQRLILVCVDGNGNDLPDKDILEYATHCPPNCDENSYFMND